MSAEREWVRGVFMGEIAYVPREVLDGSSEDGPIAPDDHIADGRLNYDTCFDSPSLAHVYDHGKTVKRFRVTLGSLSEVFTPDTEVPA